MTCIRLDATVVTAHSDKELAEPTFKGFGLLTELAAAVFPVQWARWVERRLRSLLMADDERCLDVAGLVGSAGGWASGDGRSVGCRIELVDPAGEVVGPVAVYLKDVQACGRSEATLRSYGMDLLRWFRFCWAAGLPWDQVTRAEARDFCRWLQIAQARGRRRRAGRRRAADARRAAQGRIR